MAGLYILELDNSQYGWIATVNLRTHVLWSGGKAF